MGYKYHQQAKFMLASVQSVEGTPVTPVGSDAIATFTPDFSLNISTETFSYAGNELDRTEGLVVTDKYVEVSADSFLPALSPIAAGVAASNTNFPLYRLFIAAGAAVTYDAGLGTAAKVTVSNSTTGNSLLTTDLVQESPADATNQTLFRIYDCRAMCDLDITVGSKAKLNWRMMGNTFDTITANAGQFPKLQNPKLVPAYGTQKTYTLPSFRMSQLTMAELQPIGTAFTGGTTKNFCFQKLSAPNLFGFEYGRFLTACEEGFDKGAVTTDVTITVLMDRADATFVPEKMLEQEYHLTFSWGSTVGQRAKITFDSLKVSNIANSTIGNYVARDITFRNGGNVSIEFT